MSLQAPCNGTSHYLCSTNVHACVWMHMHTCIPSHLCNSTSWGLLDAGHCSWPGIQEWTEWSNSPLWICKGVQFIASHQRGKQVSIWLDKCYNKILRLHCPGEMRGSQKELLLGCVMGKAPQQCCLWADHTGSTNYIKCLKRHCFVVTCHLFGLEPPPSLVLPNPH